MRVCSSYMAMVIIQLTYAGSNVLVKLAFDKGLNQLVFIVYRHIISMLIIFPFAYVLERKERPSLSFLLMVKIFFLASMGTTIYLNVYYAGLRCTSPTVAGALSNLIPSLTLLAAVLLGMESVKLRSGRGRAKAIGTVISIGGSLTLTLWKGKRVWNGWAARGALVHVSESEKEKWVEGAVLIVISCVCWSTWLILQASISNIYPAPLSLNFFINLFAVLQSSLAAAIFWGRNPTLWKIGWDVQLLAIVYCGVMVSGLSYYLQTWCISKKGPVFASMFTPLQLLIVGLFSAFAFGEQLHLGSLIGAVVIIAGMYCVLWGKRIEEEPLTSCGIPRRDDDDEDDNV